MADNWQEYVKDSRLVCKYGTKCYQKNPEHHSKYKHPPLLKKNHTNRNTKRYSPYNNKNAGDKQDKHQSPNTSNKDYKEVLPKTSGDIEDDKKQHVRIVLPDNITFYDKDTDRSVLKELFLVDMPEDFFKFYEFVNNIGKSAEETLASVNLELIGPYDLLLGKLPKLDKKELYLIHWRFFYDPPELQTVLKKKNSEYHIGYYRDTPDQKTALLASSDSAKGYHITLMSDNIFGAVYSYLQNEKKNSPFTAMTCQKLMDKIKAYAEENSISLAEFDMKKRISQTVTKTFHGAGIVVPYNKKTSVGYRHLADTDANLKKLFTSLQKSTSREEKDKYFSDLQLVVTNASIAVDEGDFGTGLELAIALFCSGLKELQAMALSNFTAAYSVLSRRSFAQIAGVHLEYRRKGSNMSLLAKV